MFFKEFNLYSAGDMGYHECRIPALLTTANGTILAFSEARKFTGRDADQIDLFLRRSVEWGNTFEDVQVLATREGWACHNPVPVQDRDTGTIWLFFCKNPKQGNEAAVPAGEEPRTVWLTNSNDDGKTWSDPVDMTSSVKRAEWLGYNTGPGHGIQMRSGRIVIPCVHGERDSRGRKSGHAHVIYSDDHGASWKVGGSTCSNTSESRVLETADGWLYINCRSTLPADAKGGYFRRVAWSGNGGETFSPLVHDAGLPEPVCQAGLLRYSLASAGADRKGKNRVVFSNPGNERQGERHHLTIRLSYDECRTWPVSRILYEGPSSYSDLCVAPDNTICCLYEKGAPQKGVSAYSGDLAFARFDLGWLTDGVVPARLLEDAL